MSDFNTENENENEEFAKDTNAGEEKVNPPEEKADPSRAQGEYSYSFRNTNDPRGSAYDPRAGAHAGFYRSSDQRQNPYAGYANPAYGAYGYQQPYGQYGYAPQFRPPYAPAEVSKKVKKTSSITTPIAIILCICTVLLSCLMGYAGAWLYRKQVGVSSDTAVLYRTIETKTDTSANDISAVADTVSDSVVEITTEYVTTGYFSFGQYVTKGAGSGVIISEDGYIVTNNHVVSDTDNGNTLADKIVVRLRNGEEYSARLVGRDADADIAVIKIEATGLSASVWGDSDALDVGERIVVVGNPLGKLGGTVTTGIISASDREITVDNTKMNLIQTDAAVNPGNSGGGMFNMSGELVGIVNAKSSGTGIEGLGFAIPGNDAKSVVEQLLQYGYVRGRVYIGVTFYEASTGGWFSGDSSGILYVYSCEAGYNDDVLKYGDQVVSVEGVAVSTKADVKAIISQHSVGDKVTFTIIRNNRTIDVEVELFEYKPADAKVDFNN